MSNTPRTDKFAEDFAKDTKLYWEDFAGALEVEAASLREACQTAEHFLSAVDKETRGKWEPAHAVLQVLRAALEVKP